MAGESFDELVAAGVAADHEQRLLVLLIRAHPDEPDNADESDDPLAGAGMLEPVAGTDLALTEQIPLASLVAEADALEYPWDLLMVASVTGEDGTMPTSEAVQPDLQAMVDAVQGGQDLSGYGLFDRDGMPVEVVPSGG